jgi:hypothetical protein
MEAIDIWRTANELLRWQGERAPEYASRRISELTTGGDPVGANVWSEILAAMAVLRMRELPHGQSRH